QLFEKLKISAEIEIMQKHFAQYPAIHFSLKDLTTGTWNEMITQLRVLVARIYDEHRYLINNLYHDQQKRYQRILDRDPTYPVSELKFALQELSIYLRQHYKRKCIVLVDEYDSPMECAYNKGYYE
ncbi:21788_t:CDS:2, partial [Gigaspora margarita]